MITMYNKIRLSKEDIIFDMPSYTIYMVLGDGWYVVDKNLKKAKRFNFRDYSYLDVMDYAESII